jgi:hypothetical protein
MEGKGKKRGDSNENKPGHPQTAQNHESYDVIEDHESFEEILFQTLRWFHQLGGPILKIALFTLLSVVQPGAADPRIGSWTLVSAQATLSPPNTLSITALNNAVHVVMSGESHLDFTAKSDGHDTAVPGNPGFDAVELNKIDKRQSEVKEMKDGALIATVREKLSADGNELTISTTTKGHPDQISVWTRTGGAKVAHDPLAGEWTEDLGKSLLHQALALKIEPDGNGGVRFAGEFNYTARFDGKLYDVKNSRNDTVVLQLVDPHTVDSIFRRDDQVTQKDRAVISADGQSMTITTTGVLENGQHLTAHIVYKKL